MALTTRALVQSYIANSASALEAIIDTIVAAVDARMLAYLGRTRIDSGTVTNEYHDGDGRSDQLLLREWPATAVASVHWWDGTTATLVPATDYALESPAQDSAGVLLYTPDGGAPAPWPSGRRNIRVTSYTAGYTTVPKDLEYAATIQVAWDLKRSGHAGGRLGERTQVVGDGNATYMVDSWAPEVLEVLDRYRAVRV